MNNTHTPVRHDFPTCEGRDDKLNKEVHVTAWYFRNHSQLISFPKRIEFDHQEYTFAEGLRMLIKKGNEIIQLFDMTDGTTNFRLRNDSQQWTLVSMKPSGLV